MSLRLTPIRLVLLRQERSQKWLAERVGKSEAVISRIVNGLVPGREIREAIASVLDVPAEQLFPVHDGTSNVPSEQPSTPGRHPGRAA